MAKRGKKPAWIEANNRTSELVCGQAPVERDWLHVASPLTIHVILRRVAHHHGLSVEDLRGPRRDRVYSDPRQLAMWLAVHLVPYASLPMIGKALNRDHTTVLYAVRKLDGWQRAGRVGTPEAVWDQMTRAAAGPEKAAA